MEAKLTQDELKDYVAMVMPYTKGKCNLEKLRASMKRTFGTPKKHVALYGYIEYEGIKRIDTVLLVKDKEAKKIGAIYLTWQLEGGKHLLDYAPRWYYDIVDELGDYIPTNIKEELEGSKYYAKV